VYVIFGLEGFATRVSISVASEHASSLLSADSSHSRCR